MKKGAEKINDTITALNDLTLHSAISARNFQTSHALSPPPVDLESKAREVALESFICEVKERFEKRFPSVPYDSPQWDFRQYSGQNDGKGNRLTWQQVFQTKVQLSRPDLVEAKLTSFHPSFSRAARAILAHQVLLNKVKLTDRLERGLGCLQHLSSSSEHGVFLNPLHKLTANDLKRIERCVLTTCMTPETAQSIEKEKFRVEHLIMPGVPMLGNSAISNRGFLRELYIAIGILKKSNAINRMHARLSHEILDLLSVLVKQQSKSFRTTKEQELEPGIVALSDAITAMADGDQRLSKIQEAVLCVMALEMCAPSRINEVMAMSIHDRLRAVDEFSEEPIEGSVSYGLSEAKVLHRAHVDVKEASVPNTLDTSPNTILMKGSKGAAWGAKPVLSFMLLMFNWCFDNLIEMGARSRMLMQHYEKHPNTLYLPPELEHLRGKPLTSVQIGRIMLLDGDLGDNEETFKTKAKNATKAAQLVRKVLSESGQMFTLDERPDLAGQIVDDRVDLIDGLAKKLPISTSRGTVGDAQNIRSFHKTDARTQYAEWFAVEKELLLRVNKAIDSLSWVTKGTQFKGRLSNMLMLFDHINRSPAYLPSALDGSDVSSRLKSQKNGKYKPSQTVFEALNLKMPMPSEDGTKIEIVSAYCRSHDPRRWLTTMALRHSGPELSQLLINLWANRVDVTQLRAYDFRSSEEKAAMTAQAVPEAISPSLLNEQDDLNLMFKNELTGAYKLKSQTIGIGLHAISVTTMDAIHSAETNHPVAKAGGKVILVFPTPFGMCLHQHFERGCTNYRGCGGACNSQRVIKGHLPTNEQARKQDKQLQDVIVAYVRRLTLARNRRVVHDLDKLDEHLGRMIRQHMNDEAIAARLIDEFLDVKDLIKDAAFKADLEDAYAFKGIVRELDNPETPSGAVIQYNNPARHGSPEQERTIEALGGRQALTKEVNTFLEGRDYIGLTNGPANEMDFNDSEDVYSDHLDDDDAT